MQKLKNSQKMLLLLLFLSIVFQSTHSLLLKYDRFFTIFISKDTFLNEQDQQLKQALFNQTLPSHIPILPNNFSALDLLITEINITVNDFSIGNQNTLDETAINLKNSSLNLNFSLAYRDQNIIEANLFGKFSLKECSLQLVYITVNGSLKPSLSVLNFTIFDVFFFEKNNSLPVTYFLLKIINANIEIVTTSCINALSKQINQFFYKNSNQTLNYVRINALYFVYNLNLTTITYSPEGVTFQGLYYIHNTDEMISKGLISKGIRPIEFLKNKNIFSNSTNMKLPSQFFQDLINEAHKQHNFNYCFNESNINIKGFQFYTGDLSFVMPSISDKFYPDTKVDIVCGSSDETPPLFQFGTSQMEIGYRVNCSIATRTDNPQYILSFDSFLHPLINLTIENNRLTFILDKMVQEGDNFYHDEKYPIAGKKGKDIMSCWITEVMKFFEVNKSFVGAIELPIDDARNYKLKFQDNSLVICGEANNIIC